MSASENKCPFMRLKEPDGEKGLPVLGSAINMFGGQLNFFVKLRMKFGNVAQFKIFNKSLTLIANPDDLRRIFKDEKKNIYSKEFFSAPVKNYFGDGVFNSFGDTWKNSRENLQPYFNKNNKSKWFPIIKEEATLYLHRLESDNTEKINAELIAVPFAQSVISRILFGIRTSNESANNLIQAMSLVSQKAFEQSVKAGFLGGILNKIPTPGNNKFNKALAAIELGIKEMIYDGGDGLVHKLIEKNLSEKEIRDECFTLFFAGQDTTASTIQFTLYLLAKYPDVQERVRQEVLVKCPYLSDVTTSSIEQIIYLQAVLNESLRLLPTFYATYRDVKEDTELGGRWIKKDTLVLLSPYVTHRHPDYWDDPDEFKPERFMEGKKFGYCFYPFGGGQRICLGAHLAKLEIMTFIALFVASFKFTLDGEVEKEVQALIKPKNGVPLVISATGYLGVL